jgi:hypothetical protein
MALLVGALSIRGGSMIKLKRRVRRDGYNYDVDWYVRKDAILGVYGKAGFTCVYMAPGCEYEVLTSVDEILKLLSE